VNFTPNGLADLTWWVKNDHRQAARILELIDEIRRDPRSGRGKPERLQGGGNIWSRRINQRDRLVYEVGSSDQITILACRFHYDDH
jgi:toxin YoeB